MIALIFFILFLIYAVYQCNQHPEFRIVRIIQTINPLIYSYQIERRNRIFKYWSSSLYVSQTGGIFPCSKSSANFLTKEDAEQAIRDYDTYLNNKYTILK